MRKKLITWFFVPGIILWIVGFAMSVIAAASIVSAAQAAQAAGTTAQVSSGTAGMGLVASVLIFIGVVLYLVSWIGALVATGKQSRWGWFVCISLLSPIAELVYLFAGPGLPAKTAEPVQNIG